MVEFKYNLTEIKLQNERSFFFLRNILSKVKPLYYRGQRSEKWNLSTSIERFKLPYNESKSLRYKDLYETSQLKEIQSFIPNYSVDFSIPSIESYSEWFSMIQHYGGRTRLLDFTEAFYIALFFALQANKDSMDSDPSAVWGVNYFSEKISEYLEHGMLTHYTDERFDRLFKKYQKNNETESNQIFVLKSKIITHRMRVQKGIFLYGRNFKNSFEKNLFQVDSENDLKNIKKNCKKVDIKEFDDKESDHFKEIIEKSKVIKFIIPSQLRRLMLNEFNDMNIGFLTLFPDLQGLMKHFYRE